MSGRSTEALTCPHCGGSADHGQLDGVAVAYCNAGDDHDGCGWHQPAAEPTRAGRWGVRQYNSLGENTGGGTIGLGWETLDEAAASNPPQHGYTFEPFERWPEVDTIRLHDCGRFHRSSESCRGGA